MKSSSLLTSVARGVIWSVVIPLFLLYAFSVRAQTYIFGRADFPVGTGVIAVAAGDFNGDGVLDMAVVNEADNTVSVLLGKSDGTFAPQVTYATGLGPLAITTGDFNGDGNLDLAVTDANCIPYKFGLNCDVRTVSILLGNGDGSFRPHIDYATGTQPSSVAVGDFNGDGKLDLAVTNEQDGTVSVLLGNGDGTFQTQVVYPIANGAQSVIVADFNGDHKLDLAVGGSQVSVLLGNGNGTFQKPLVSPGTAPLAVADFNGDSKLDLYAGGDILLGDGNGTFVLNATYPDAAAAAVADLNGDGKPDLVLAQCCGVNSSDGYSVAVLLGNGDGTFQAAVEYGTAPFSSALIVADFNGEGKFDLALTDPNCDVYNLSCSTPGAVSILLGLGDGTFVGGKDYSPGGVSSQQTSGETAYLMWRANPARSTYTWEMVTGRFSRESAHHQTRKWSQPVISTATERLIWPDSCLIAQTAFVCQVTLLFHRKWGRDFPVACRLRCGVAARIRGSWRFQWRWKTGSRRYKLRREHSFGPSQQRRWDFSAAR